MEGIRGQLHPLQNADVLELLFKNLPLDDLKNCRLVCRAWLHSTAEAMKTCAKIRIYGKPFNRRKRNVLKTKRMRKFLILVKNRESKFLEAPFIDTFHIKKGEMNHPGFWRLCSHFIRSLILEDVHFQSVMDLRYILLFSCPNLEELKLLCVSFEGWFDLPRPVEYEWVEEELLIQNWNLKSLEFKTAFGMDAGLAWTEIFTRFPSIQDLKIEHFREGTETIFRALAFVRRHKADYVNLKKLTFRFDTAVPNKALAEAVLDGKLALEEFSFEWLKVPEDVKTVQRILSAHAPTLKKLSLDTAYDTDEPLFPLPDCAVLKNVEELRYKVGENLNSMCFLAFVPNLKKLRFLTWDIPEEKGCENWVLETCKELVLNDVIDDLKVEDVKRFGKWLPNLERLEVENLDNETFVKVCECWPKLRFLKVSFSTWDDDAGISNLGNLHLERIHRDGGERYWRPITGQRANIVVLKNLEKFRWVTADPKIRLGHCSTVYGIEALTERQE